MWYYSNCVSIYLINTLAIFLTQVILCSPSLHHSYDGCVTYRNILMRVCVLITDDAWCVWNRNTVFIRVEHLDVCTCWCSLAFLLAEFISSTERGDREDCHHLHQREGQQDERPGGWCCIPSFHQRESGASSRLVLTWKPLRAATIVSHHYITVTMTVDYFISFSWG